MGMELYVGDWFEFSGGAVHPDVVKLCRHARGRQPTGYEREQIRERVKTKLAFIHQTERKVGATEANMQKIDALLKELATELKQEHEQERSTAARKKST